MEEEEEGKEGDMDMGDMGMAAVQMVTGTRVEMAMAMMMVVETEEEEAPTVFEYEGEESWCRTDRSFDEFRWIRFEREGKGGPLTFFLCFCLRFYVSFCGIKVYSRVSLDRTA